MLLIHLADTTGYTAIIGQSILQNKSRHAGLAAIHQILMNSLESFFTIVVICIDNYKRSLQQFVSCQYRLTGSPRFCTTFRKFSWNIVNILESVIYSYIMR